VAVGGGGCAVAYSVEALCYKQESFGVDFPSGPSISSVGLILPTALRHRVHLNRNECHVWLTT
jgi:hypothetical protein